MSDRKVILQYKNVSKYYGDVKAVDKLDLCVYEGEIFVLLGPNGAGKTTTLKLIAGLLNITEGEIYFLGKKIDNTKLEYKKHIAYIPDVPFVYDKLKLKEYIEFIAGIYNIDLSKSIENLQKNLERFNIKQYLNYPMENLSHGMRQKALISMALIHNPKLLIIDEPLVGLDPISAKFFRELIIRESRENNKTFFISTHSLDFAAEIADRIGILDKGKLILCDSIDKIIEEKTKQKLEDFFIRLTME